MVPSDSGFNIVRQIISLCPSLSRGADRALGYSAMGGDLNKCGGGQMCRGCEK